MKNRILLIAIVAAICASSASAAPKKAAPKISAVAQARIKLYGQLLPEYEALANACMETLKAYDNSTDDLTIVAADAARLQARSILDIRGIIEKDPNFFTWHIAPKKSLEAWKKGMEYYLGHLRAKTDPFADMGQGERTVRSKIDGFPIVYRITLPTDYDPTKKYPLHLELHHATALRHYASWLYGVPRPRSKGRKDGMIHVYLDGRGSNTTSGLAHAAFLETYDDICKRYSIDKNRVIVGGDSMGAASSYRMTHFHPDLFAAGYGVTGQPCYHLPTKNGRFDPAMVTENAANVPFCHFVAPKEAHSPAMLQYIEGHATLKKKYPDLFPILVVSDPKGEHGRIDRKLLKKGHTWVRSHIRNPYPKHVLFKTYNLRFDHSFWVTIDMVANPDVFARMDAKVTPNGGVQVKPENVTRFHLDMVPKLLGQRDGAPVTIDGQAPISTPVGKKAYFALDGKTWRLAEKRYPDGLVKKHGLSGPLFDVFMERPVLMVHGTVKGKSKADAMTMIDRASEVLLKNNFHRPFERRADKDVSAADLKKYDLVLFGKPSENSFLAKINESLPVRYAGDAAVIGDKKFDSDGVSIVLTYPNPLNPERYVLLLPENYGDYTGNHPESTARSTSARISPDYIIGVPDKAWNGPTIKPLAKGNFDSFWKLASPPESP